MSEQTEPAPAPDLPATEVRQGRKGVPVLWVLTISVVLGVLVLALVWGMFKPGFSRVQSGPENGTAAAAGAAPHSP